MTMIGEPTGYKRPVDGDHTEFWISKTQNSVYSVPVYSAPLDTAERAKAEVIGLKHRVADLEENTADLNDQRDALVKTLTKLRDLIAVGEWHDLIEIIDAVLFPPPPVEPNRSKP